MSYILDALKKSERERRQVDAPTMQRVQPMHATAGSTQWLQPIAGGVGVGLLLALLWWALSGAYKVSGDSKPAIKAADIAEPVNKSSSLRSTASAASAVAPPVENSKPLIDYTATVDAPPPMMPAVQETSAPAPPILREAAKPVIKPKANVIAPSKPAPTPVVAVSKTPIEEVKKLPAIVELAALPPKPTPAQTQLNQDKKTDELTQANDVVPANADPARIYNLPELPVAVRRGVPKMNIPGYIMSSEPNSRTVTINEKNLKEGDELIAGLRVDSIGQDFLMMSYKGYRFRVEMF
jgi:general secretion pathway protein B